MKKLHHPLSWTLLIATLWLLLFSGLTFWQTAEPAKADPPPRTAFVHLFEWKWTDIAQECENYLGPKGFAAVQVSPPMEHAVVSGYPWWQRYQPVSYQLTSRSGSRAEFANMVARCNAVGVGIYVDAVINHMTGVGSGTGSAGSSYTSYSYPNAGYGFNDFHHCGRNGNDDIANYQDRWEVQNCELVNLADLNTGSTYVRDHLAAYLNDLTGLGVAGFRIDAAKHMDTNDMLAIVNRLNGTPYIYQEVIDQGGEPITAGEYFQNGDVTEFKYSINIGNTFFSGQLANLSQFGPAWGFMPSDKAVVFTDNHDNQRGHGGGGHVVTYKDGSLYELANVFMLAWPYGYPGIMSSFAFSTADQGPPSDGNGNTQSVYVNGSPSNCFGVWICEHRWQSIGNMVAFRNYTNANFTVTNWWSNGNNQIAFGRGSAGYVAINREGSALNRTFQTSMAAGNYCNVIDGNPTATGCSGTTITVNANGTATFTVPSMKAVAIHIGAKAGTGGGATPTPVLPTATSPATATTQPGSIAVNFKVNATTTTGQNVYVVGNVAALGSWNTANAVLLSSAAYPIWQGTVGLAASTAVEYKYIKRDGSGNVVWESGVNRAFTTPASGSVTRNDTWDQTTAPQPTPTGSAPTATPIPPTATLVPPTATPTSGTVAVTFKENATTTWGQNIYVVGSTAALGNWNTANAVLLSSASYPVWQGTINLPANTTVEYKYIKRDGSGNVVWESGANRVVTLGTTAVTLNDTWK